MSKGIFDYNVYLFDVDGTLYNQKKMRLRMLLKLIFHYATHIWKWNELLSIYWFRVLREQCQYQTATLEEFYALAGQKAHLSATETKRVVEHWMFQVPLEIMCACAYDSVLTFIRKASECGKRIYIYSDYPAEDKLTALQLPWDGIFTANDPEIGGLKPNKSAMEHILHTIRTAEQDILYVGDRDEKDGISASLVNIPYCNIRHFLENLN